ncbi:hypothetical protein BJX70DRAFT_378560 [Aspergillus crustosus]
MTMVLTQYSKLSSHDRWKAKKHDCSSWQMCSLLFVCVAFPIRPYSTVEFPLWCLPLRGKGRLLLDSSMADAR